MATALQDIFNAARDPLEVQNELVAQRLQSLSQQHNAASKVGWGLGMLFANLAQKRRTGDARPTVLRTSQETQNALTAGVEAAGPQGADERYEDYQARQMDAIHQHLMSLDPKDIDPNVLQQVASSRAALGAQAEEARYQREQRANTLQIQQTQLATQQWSLEQNILEGRDQWLYDKDNKEFLGVYNAADPQGDAALDDLVRQNPDRYIPMTRDQVVAIEDRDLMMRLDRSTADVVDARKVRQQAFAASRAMESAVDITNLFTEGGIENITSRTWGERLRGRIFSGVLNLASLTDAFRLAQSQGTLGQVYNKDGTITEIETNVQRLLQSNSSLAKSLSEANVDMATFNSLTRNLAYAVARSNDPSGRLSDFDVEISMGIIGAALTNPEALGRTLETALFPGVRNIRRQLQYYKDIAEREGTEVESWVPLLDNMMSEQAAQMEAAVQRISGTTRRRTGSPVNPGEQTVNSATGQPVPRRFDTSNAFEE